jgi:hypothetical protein
MKDSIPKWKRKMAALRRGPKVPANGVKLERDELDILAEQEVIRGLHIEMP